MGFGEREGGDVVDVFAIEGGDDVGEVFLEDVEIHDGFDFVQYIGGDGDGDEPIVGVDGLEGAIGEGDGVGGTEGGLCGYFKHKSHRRVVGIGFVSLFSGG